MIAKAKRARAVQLALMICCCAAFCGTAIAAGNQEAAELAKEVQNPLATLVSLPFQANYNNGVGSDDRTFFNLNIQPVIPFPGKKWDVISRTIIPLNSAPVPGSETESEFGLGDTSMSLFWTSDKKRKLTWGVGPAISIPTSSNPEVLGSGKWSVGPTGVIFYGTGQWTLGGVVSNIWSVAGDSDREDVNFFVAQYFVNYNFGGGLALGSAPIITCNWEAESGEQCTVPWGLQVSKVTHFGSRPVNLILGYYVNSEHPTGGPENQARVQVNFMYPQKKQKKK
jgi:hypothetical protein